MRAILFVITLFAGLSASAQTTPPVAATRPAAPNPNAVVIATGTAWWSSAEFDRPITLVINSVDLDAAIDGLGRAAKISLVSAGGTKARKKVTLNLRGAPLRDVMLALANLYGLTWFRTGEVYTLTYLTASQKALGPSLPRLRQPTLQPLPSIRVPARKTYRRR